MLLQCMLHLDIAAELAVHPGVSAGGLRRPAMLIARIKLRRASFMTAKWSRVVSSNGVSEGCTGLPEC